MRWIGLTGGIASGKSTTADIFMEMGIPIISADKLSHQAISPGSDSFEKILNQFGKDILDENGNIDRDSLGQIVFNDSKKLELLEGILHPEIRRLANIEKKRLETEGHSMAIYDVPLLFEKNMQNLFDEVITVTCDFEVQLERLMKRNQLSRDEAKKRIDLQMPLSDKVSKSDVVFENNSDLENLKKQVVSYVNTPYNQPKL